MHEETPSHKDTIMLCAGGTGGHMFPAMALAHDLISRGRTIVLLTDKRGEKYIRAAVDGLAVRVISSATLPKGIAGKIGGLISLTQGWLQSRRLVARYSPAIVIGFGGYPSLPPMIVAQQKNIPTIIHEQNAVLGRANAYLAPKADRIALSLSDFSSLEEADAIRAVVTGNPVRSDIAALYAHPYNSPDTDAPFTLLVMGGSQGAKIMREIVPDALLSLPKDLRQRLAVIQQCHEDDIAALRRLYDDALITADIRPFFDDIPDVLKKASLVIARSGASTVAEVSIVGCPAIYVPFTRHADQQQKVNAQTVVNKGGAWIMEEGKDFTPAALAGRIESLMRSPEDLFRAAEGARNCAKPDAARKLGNLVIALLKGWDKEAARPFDYTQGHRGE